MHKFSASVFDLLKEIFHKNENSLVLAPIPIWTQVESHAQGERNLTKKPRFVLAGELEALFALLLICSSAYIYSGMHKRVRLRLSFTF